MFRKLSEKPLENAPFISPPALRSVGDKPLVLVEGVSKSFILRRDRVRALRDRLSFTRLTGEYAKSEEFWALRDVSFAVYPGQSVGIIGHNGSGKSTLLKLLTGILKPTSGKVAVHGRVGALIEVGAGFHPDLTGRENIFLNASIMGLSRREVAGKFDEIVQFASLERFIDTPVKRYSSGMFMRLGFSIAVHTQPDILLIDEVLAVGDTLFQRKCLRRLEQFVKEGGAAVFVSHGMAHVAELCQTCVWLDRGEARYIGETEKAIEQYMAVVSEREDEEFQREHPEEWAALDAERRAIAEREERERQKAEQERQRAEQRAREELEAVRRKDQEWEDSYNRSRFSSVTLRDRNDRPCSTIYVGESLNIHLTYQFIEPPSHPVFALEFHRSDGIYAFGTSNYDYQVVYEKIPRVGQVVLHIATVNLNAGQYRVRTRLFHESLSTDWSEHPDDVVDNAAELRVEAGAFGHGCVFMPVVWESAPTAASDSIAPWEIDSPTLQQRNNSNAPSYVEALK